MTDSISVEDYVDMEQFKKDVAIGSDLNVEFENQAMFYVFYANLQAQAKKNYDDASAKLDLVRASLDLKIREEASESGEKITETKIASKILIQSAMQAAIAEKNEARQMLEVTAAMARGFEQRKDMLIQRGASDRQERSGEMRMSSSKSDMSERIAKALQEQGT